ncbi:hypothetical protein AAEO56_09405 [Flavobacterium sp. DGU11]|uniref:Uncharacterized protein n=1 Tax=Flavobacterium arundinis TaxID=3139143 RepID=A0ABU9HWF4_9FLAO
MKYLIIFITLITFSAKAQVMHCGYDFTSYVVLDVHESGKKENIKNLRITIVDSLGNDLINTANKYSFKNADEPMVFSFNYLIGDDNKRLAEGAVASKERWFFPFAKDNYLISVANTFEADRFQIKIEDKDGKENGGKFKTVILPLYSYNMYVLCSNESQQAAMKFGRKMNKPVDVVLEKE